MKWMKNEDKDEDDDLLIPTCQFLLEKDSSY